MGKQLRTTGNASFMLASAKDFAATARLAKEAGLLQPAVVSAVFAAELILKAVAQICHDSFLVKHNLRGLFDDLPEMTQAGIYKSHSSTHIRVRDPNAVFDRLLNAIANDFTSVRYVHELTNEGKLHFTEAPWPVLSALWYGTQPERRSIPQARTKYDVEPSDVAFRKSE